jgi:hypothetical protein
VRRRVDATSRGDGRARRRRLRALETAEPGAAVATNTKKAVAARRPPGMASNERQRDDREAMLIAAGPPMAAGGQSGKATDKGCFVLLPRPPGHQRCGGLGGSRLAHIVPTCRAPHSSFRAPRGAM